MKKYLTMDIGGTLIKYSIMDQEFHEENLGSDATKKEPEAFLDQLKRLIEEYKHQICGIAISIGGFIDPVTGLNSDYSVGENFSRYNLKKILMEYSGLPVAIENDSNCAAIAEYKLGAGKGCEDICMVTVGTGIGGGIILGGKLHRGKNFKAGEFGFMLIGQGKEADEYQLKSAGATWELVDRVSKAVHHTVDGYYIFDHLDDPVISKIYEDWLESLALVIGNIAVCFDPEKVLIGGGICTQKRFIKDLSSRVYELFHPLEKYTKIEACILGNNAGKIGALIGLLHSDQLGYIKEMGCKQ